MLASYCQKTLFYNFTIQRTKYVTFLTLPISTLSRRRSQSVQSDERRPSATSCSDHIVPSHKQHHQHAARAAPGGQLQVSCFLDKKVTNRSVSTWVRFYAYVCGCFIENKIQKPIFACMRPQKLKISSRFECTNNFSGILVWIRLNIVTLIFIFCPKPFLRKSNCLVL